MDVPRRFKMLKLAAPVLALLAIVGGVLLAVSVQRPKPLKVPDPVEGMVFVPAGTFVMGSELGAGDERPRREVYLNAFYMDRYEVTNGEYVEFLNAVEDRLERCGGHLCMDTKDEDPDSHILYQAGRYAVETGYENHPVIKVSWYGARAYCEYRGKRLPSEAEWEKAARGIYGRAYPWGDEFDAYRANTDYRVGDMTPVGSYPDGVSPYGAYDVAGNVWEWVADWYQAYPGSDYRSDFLGQKYKVVRGGSWNHPGHDARCTCRDIAHPARCILVVGFRCARAPSIPK
jgi:formylglycine-generating enzyme required for sulfatase activity